MNLGEIANVTGKDWIMAARDLLRDDGGKTVIARFTTEEGVRIDIRHPLSMIGTDTPSVDGLLKDPLTAVHPRTYSTYPRVLERYIKKERLLTLPEAIRKMTSFPAQVLKLYDRG